MAIKSGRVGVREDQVDVHGRIIATDYLVEQIKAKLNAEETHELPGTITEPGVSDTESN